MAPRSGMDTLLVGLDAACLPVLEPLFDDGAVPTIASIFEDGAAGPLESQIPPWTASAWPSLYTGTNPGKHGVFGFLTYDGYDWDVVNATNVRERPVWELADHHGLSSVVVNAPVTHPPREFDGALIPGYVAPDDPTCHPEGLLAEVREEIGEYRVYAPNDAEGDREQVEWYRRLSRMRGEAFRYLAEEFDPEFGFVQFQQTDTVFHEFPGDDAKVRAVYETVDEQVAAILDTCDPDTVIVASDHGMGPYSDEFRVNEFLREEGYVTAKRGGEGMPEWKSVRQDQLGDGEGYDSDPASASSPADRSAGELALERAVRTAAEFGITAQAVGRTLDRLGLLEVVLEHVPWRLVRSGSEQVDFPASAAYMRSQIECGVRLNVEGREPEGVVPESEYESVRSGLVSLLEGARTADGRPAFDDVAPREEYFHGPHVEDAVDIVVVPRDFDVHLQPWLLGDISGGTAGEKYDHKRHGVVAAAGDGVDSAASVEDAHLFDVAPTVLSALGVPRSERMDGTALPFVDPTDEAAYPDRDPQSTERTDDEGVESRLRDLGYLDIDEG